MAASASDPERNHRRLLLQRCIAALALVAYLAMTGVCFATIAVGVLTGRVLPGLVGTALIVFYASEAAELARWLHTTTTTTDTRPAPSLPPRLHPTWAVPCAVLVFVLLAGLVGFLRST